jgi:hypothetical protein
MIIKVCGMAASSSIALFGCLRLQIIRKQVKPKGTLMNECPFFKIKDIGSAVSPKFR